MHKIWPLCNKCRRLLDSQSRQASWMILKTRSYTTKSSQRRNQLLLFLISSNMHIMLCTNGCKLKIPLMSLERQLRKLFWIRPKKMSSGKGIRTSLKRLMIQGCVCRCINLGLPCLFWDSSGLKAVSGSANTKGLFGFTQQLRNPIQKWFKR